jgi:anaerobic selenocysteine-containing dehydrogenase/Fe-S-cluster-containing dehydrogenase component
VIERRQFLKTLGLAGSAAVLDSCAQQNVEQLIPSLVSPDAVVSGERAYYPTTCRACPAGCGLIAAAINGRITKAEGNPQHPIGQGRLCARGQAAVQSVYTPHRFRQPLLRDAHGVLQPLSWGDAEQLFAAKLRDARRRVGNRIAWIGRLETGPFEELLTMWLRALGTDRRLAYETFDYHAIRDAAQLAFDRAEIPRYAFDRADFILGFGADFLETWISNVEFTNGYARLRARRERDAAGSFAWVSCRLSLTGLNADVWLPSPPGSEASIAWAIAHAIVADGRTRTAAIPTAVREALDRFTPELVASRTGVAAEAIRDLALRFASASSPMAVGGGMAAADDRSAVDLELAVSVLNALVGSIGSTVVFDSTSALNQLATRADLIALSQSMRAGEIDILMTHHANPVYGLPPAVGFADALSHVPFVVSFDTLQDETTDRAHLVMPDHHDLESWGAYAPRSNVVGLMQPAAAPLFDTRATGDVLIEVAQQVEGGIGAAVGTTAWRDRVKSWWRGPWNDISRHGGRFAPAPQPSEVSLRDVSAAITASELEPVDSTLTFVAYPTTQFFDGRHADASWLQELPDPVNKTVWTNCAEIHPETAARFGIGEADDVELATAHGRVSAQAHLNGGLHPNVVAMAIGYGRTASMRNAAGRGSNAVVLLPPGEGNAAAWRVRDVTIRRASGGRRLTVLQAETNARPDGAPASAKIVRPDRVDIRAPAESATVQFYPPHQHPLHRWGMAIDLNACTGCSACVVACTAENNVAVVGPQFCEQGREMSWIRIEREAHDIGAAGGLRTPANVFLPMLCQQCDNAPCEAVCPVYATYHNPEGLNAQIYPRCIGTRFCSNNCPYKVRRFNWARYGWEAPLGEQLNPDVTVRSVGVMEKCTFCVQRIEAGKLAATREQRAVRDGDIVPACAQTCPADAIVFGDLHDPDSRVSRLSAGTRGYHVLEELNTRPAITYLRRVVPGSPEHAD